MGRVIPPPQGEGKVGVTTEIIREIIIPVIEKEVNEGQNFAQLRQIFHSLILASWYKKTLKKNLLNKIYTNQKKVAGVNIDDPQMKEKIYQQYLTAFKKGVYSYIKEDYDKDLHAMIPRKYFSGGVWAQKIKESLVTTDNSMLARKAAEELRSAGRLVEVQGIHVPTGRETDVLPHSSRLLPSSGRFGPLRTGLENLGYRSFGQKLVSSFMGGLVLFFSVEAQSAMFERTPQRKFLATVEKNDDLWRVVINLSDHVGFKPDYETLLKILQEVQDDNHLAAIYPLEEGLVLDLTDAERKLKAADYLQKVQVMETQDIRIHDKAYKIYYVDPGASGLMKGFFETVIGDNIFVNMPSLIREAYFIFSTQDYNPDFPGREILMRKILQGKSLMDVSMMRLQEKLYHAIIHLVTVRAITEGPAKEQLMELLRSHRVDDEDMLSVAFELLAYLGQMVYTAEPNFDLNFMNTEAFHKRWDAPAYQITGQIISKIIFDKLGYKNYLINRQIAEKKAKNGNTLSEEEIRTTRLATELMYDAGAFFNHKHYPWMTDFVSTFHDNQQPIRDAAREWYEKLWGELPPFDAVQVPENVRNHLWEKYQRHPLPKSVSVKINSPQLSNLLAWSGPLQIRGNTIAEFIAALREKLKPYGDADLLFKNNGTIRPDTHMYFNEEDISLADWNKPLPSGGELVIISDQSMLSALESTNTTTAPQNSQNPDEALVAVPPRGEEAPGGIDFTADKINVRSQGPGVELDLPFDPNIFESTPLPGLTPVIYRILPITNLSFLEETPTALSLSRAP